MCDGGAGGEFFRGTDGIDVNPLIVERHLRKGVDHLLGDRDPFTHAEFFADVFFEFVRGGDEALRHGETLWVRKSRMKTKP